MHPQIELNLALILFLPWFAILGVLYWRYPRTPHSRTRRLFDLASLLLATGAAVAGMWTQIKCSMFAKQRTVSANLPDR